MTVAAEHHRIINSQGVEDCLECGGECRLGRDEPVEDEYVTNKILALPHLKDPKSSWEWQDSGACRQHPDLSFFTSSVLERERCRTVCRTCVVRVQCLDFALRNAIPDGVWGGMTPQERSKQ